MAVTGGQADLRPAESTTSPSLPLFAEPRETSQPPTGQSHCNRNPLHTATADRSHSHATDLVRRGVPIEVVARLLTHRSSTTTSQVYVHLDPADIREALRRAGVWREEEGR